MILSKNKMLIPEKLNTIIRILLANTFENKPHLTASILSKKAKITYAMAKRHLIRLEKSGYVTIKGEIKVINPIKLLMGWGYTYSIRELERVEFVSAERPQYVIAKIANWTRKHEIPYAFTLFSATEQVSPYVAPSSTYIYINKKDVELWEKFFREEKILPAEKEGNVICLLVDEDYFQGILDVRGVKIVSLSQLYADLMSFGGRGEEATTELIKIIKEKMKNV